MHNRIKLHAFFFGKNNERKGKSMIVQLIENIYQFLWGEWIHVPLPGGGSLGLSLLIILLLPAGIVFTIKTRFLPIRLFPDMVKALTANNKNGKDEKSSLSSLQTLIVSTATRVGMGNLTGVVAAISAGGAGAVFWMWITALLGSSTAFIEATLAQLHKEKDPPVWWISRRTSLLYTPLYGRKTRKEEKTHADRCLICDFRIDLLVWDQSGSQQFCSGVI